MSEPNREALKALANRLDDYSAQADLDNSGSRSVDCRDAANYIRRRAAKPERERVIAQAICCPRGCRYEGDSEDGSRCYCDTTDYNGSGIERKAQAVVRALKGTPS